MKFQEVKAEIAKMRDEGKSYAYIGDNYGVNKGLIHLIHNRDYEPKRKDIRRKLGLEDLTIDFVRQVRNTYGRFARDEEIRHPDQN